MKTEIFLWSMDQSVPIGNGLSFEGFTKQVEYYFNQFGHLPKRGVIVSADKESLETPKGLIYVDEIHYRGIYDNCFVIGISLSTRFYHVLKH